MTDTREALLAAVETVLDEQGLDKLSLRVVGRAAGVSHAAPGKLFGDKAGMLTVFAARGFDALRAEMSAAYQQCIEAGEDGPFTLAAVGRAYVAFAIARPAVFTVMFRQDLLHAHDPDYVAAARRAHRPLAASLERCRDQGFVEADRVADTLITAWALVHGLVMLWFSKHLVGRLPEGATAETRARVPTVLAERVTALFTGLLREAPGPRPGR